LKAFSLLIQNTHYAIKKTWEKLPYVAEAQNFIRNGEKLP